MTTTVTIDTIIFTLGHQMMNPRTVMCLTAILMILSSGGAEHQQALIPQGMFTCLCNSNIKRYVSENGGKEIQIRERVLNDMELKSLIHPCGWIQKTPHRIEFREGDPMR